MKYIKRKKRYPRHQHLDFLSQILSCFAIGSLFFLAIGMKGIDNYMDWFLFSVTMIITGFLFATILYIILSFFIPDVRSYKNAKGIGLLFPLALAFSFIFFGIGSIINESSNNNSECKEYIIHDLGRGGSRQKTDFVLINNGNKTERLSFGSDFNKVHHVGDTINLCLITGGLGFKYYKINTSLTAY
ncbi:hypothetical protein [Pedobacter cryoconitis]|uniref:Uncharacterized protein n=1 Tax=Pedobacter cryoconitis TaxID=188932 RepID=A0A7X0MIH1_9SPHI|nr:hypothetical protein [Pedobacter cryoconitis]MBB6499921.1 hypothetical protein [Pedobacter cryoconitis]